MFFLKQIKMNTKLLKNQVNILTLFARSFGFLQGAGLRSSEVVRVVRRAWPTLPATPQGSKRLVTACGKQGTIKTSLFPGKASFSRTLICKNEPN